MDRVDDDAPLQPRPNGRAATKHQSKDLPQGRPRGSSGYQPDDPADLHDLVSIERIEAAREGPRRFSEPPAAGDQGAHEGQWVSAAARGRASSGNGSPSPPARVSKSGVPDRKRLSHPAKLPSRDHSRIPNPAASGDELALRPAGSTSNHRKPSKGAEHPVKRGPGAHMVSLLGAPAADETPMQIRSASPASPEPPRCASRLA